MASLAPSAITRSTLSRILSHYPATAQNVFRSKMITRSKKITKGDLKRSAAQAQADEALGLPPAPPPAMRPEDDPMVEQPRFEREVCKFRDIDTWRYETLPALLRERRLNPPEPLEVIGKQGRKAQRLAKDMQKKKRNEHKKYQIASVTMEKDIEAAMKEGDEGYKLSNLFFTKDELMRLYEWQS